MVQHERMLRLVHCARGGRPGGGRVAGPLEPRGRDPPAPARAPAGLVAAAGRPVPLAGARQEPPGLGAQLQAARQAAAQCGRGVADCAADE